MKLPVNCPSCDANLQVSSLHCTKCETSINGKFDIPVYLQLSPEEQSFVMQFLLASGSLKEMAAKEKMSYPTLRNKMDDLIDKIKNLQL